VGEKGLIEQTILKFYACCGKLRIKEIEFLQIACFEINSKILTMKYSQTCVQWPLLGPEKRGRYAKDCMKNISGK